MSRGRNKSSRRASAPRRAPFIEPLEQRTMFAAFAGVPENFIGPLEAEQYEQWVAEREAAGIPTPAPEPQPEPTPPPPAPPVVPTIPPIDVKDFGAVGNGTANDTAALTAAVAALKAAGPGHTLLLPAGTYRIGSSFLFNEMSDFTVRGEGATIKPFGSMTVASYQGDVMRLVNCTNFTVEGLTLDANRAHRNHGPAVTLRVFGSSDFVVRNCTMKNATWDHIYVAASYSNGEVSHRSHAGRFENNTLEDAWRHGIGITNGYDLHFVGNTVRNVHDLTGIDIEANSEDGPDSVTDIVIDGNTFEACATIAVYAPSLHLASRITVSNNVISNTPSAVVLYGNDHRILNNTVNGKNTVNIGIGVVGSNALIQGNTLRNGKHAAIYAAGSANVIRANTIIDYGYVDSGCCIHTSGGEGGGLIEGNEIRKTIPDSDWLPILKHSNDVQGVNYRYGVRGADGAF